MKQLKKSLAYVLAFITVFSSFTILPSEFWGLADVSAVDLTTKVTSEEEIDEEQTYTENGLVYSIMNKKEVKIVDYKGINTDVVIPNTTKGTEFPELANKKVTIIGDGAFKGKDITSITFGNNVLGIGNYAFQNCSKLEVVIITDNIKAIGESAFAYCSNLKKVDVGDKITTIKKRTFYQCDSLHTLIIGNGVVTIEEEAFTTSCSTKIFIYSLDIQKISNNSLPRNSSIYCYKYSSIDDSYSSTYYVIQHSGYSSNIRFFGGSSLPYRIKVNGVDVPNFHSDVRNYTIYVNDTSVVNFQLMFEGISTSYGIPRVNNVYTVMIYNSSDEHSYMYNITVKEIVNTRPTNITVNGTNINNFEAYTKEYTAYVDDITNVNIAPVFVKPNVEYSITADNNLYTITIYDHNDNIVLKYKITLKEVAYPSNIKVNGVPVNNFNKTTKEYTVYVDDIENVAIAPIFNQSDTIYKVTSKNNVYTIGILDENNNIAYTYTITIKENPSIVNIPPIDIKVNDVSVINFKETTKDYTVYVDDIANVAITPIFENDNIKYEVKAENNVYTLNIFNEGNFIAYTYKITVKEKVPEVKYTVIGDVTLTLDKISATKVGGSVALPKGTYRLKLAKDDIEFGYSKRVKDYCSLTLSEKYKGFITFDTTGGTYTFQFDTTTNKLTIKHDSYLPNEYLIGDIDTILKPVGDRPLSIGTQQLPEGTYKFKLSICGKKHGYNKVVDNATVGSLTVNSKFSADITLNATGGMYTFILNTETNKLIIRHTPTDNEDTTDVHISGTFNLVLNDKSATGEKLTIATGTITLTSGCHTFRVYNYGTVYTASTVINDKATKNLSSKYTTPVTLNATGGTYRFTFNKTTGALTVSTI